MLLTSNFGRIYARTKYTAYFGKFLEKDKSKADYRKWSCRICRIQRGYYSISIRVLLFLPIPIAYRIMLYRSPNLAV